MFSIIIPTHDRPELLGRTLRSLIAQTYQEFTVIIVSDSSTYIPPYQELLALNGRYVYIIRSGVTGPAESRNMGMAVANQDYILFLDDDDTFEPGHLQAVADSIGDKKPELTFCSFKIMHEDRTKSPPEHKSTDILSIADVTKESIFVRNRIPNSCLVYRRDILSNIKYEAEMIIYEDWDFLLKCLKGVDLTYLPINSVVIHKSLADAPQNMRRGNTRDDLIVETMLYIYKKHTTKNMETRLIRQALMASAGISLAIELC